MTATPEPLEEQEIILSDLKNEVKEALPENPTTDDVLEFAHNAFSHGQEQPSSFDSFTILADARAGKQMRCVEHSLLAADLLQTYDVPARIIAGLALDPDIPSEVTGHVFTEYWDKRSQKWIMADVQWGITPVHAGKSLSALELREAFDADQLVEFVPFGQVRDDAKSVDYKEWVRPYLDIFDSPGVVAVSRNLSQSERTAQFRMSLPRNESLAEQYKGFRSPNITYVSPSEFYAPPL